MHPEAQQRQPKPVDGLSVSETHHLTCRSPDRFRVTVTLHLIALGHKARIKCIATVTVIRPPQFVFAISL